MTAQDKLRTIAAVQVKGPAALGLRWSDGTRATLDVTKLIIGRAYRSLRDPKTFARARIGEWGHSIAWPGEIDLSAEVLWLETLSAAGRDDARTFLEWRLRHGLSLNGAAQALGISRRMVAYYSNGEKPVPKAILLACKGWEVSSAA